MGWRTGGREIACRWGLCNVHFAAFTDSRCCGRSFGQHVFSVMVGTARCAVPTRVVAVGTNDRAGLAFERVTPLHAARTLQRHAPTRLYRYFGHSRGLVVASSAVRSLTRPEDAVVSPHGVVLAGFLDRFAPVPFGSASDAGARERDRK